MSRLCAFKSSGQYYVFNNDKTALVPIKFNPNDPIYTNWMDATELNDLTEEQCSKLSNYFLELYSDIEDDVYTVTMENFDVLKTTDTTHFVLTGFAGILNMDFYDTSATCRVILSFDGRKNWVYYDTTDSTWKKTSLNQIYSSKSNTVSQINALTKTEFDLIFTKHCTLDYAVSITNAEHVGYVVIELPDNQPPRIISLTVEQNQTTHDKFIKVKAHVEDFEGDGMSFEIRRTFKGLGNNQNIPKEGYNDVPPIQSGVCNPGANGYFEYYIDPANIEIGYSDLSFVYTDEKGKSTTGIVEIHKINDDAYISMTINRNTLSYTIYDADSDSGYYRIILNDTIITPDKEQEPIIPGDTETGWSPLINMKPEQSISGTIELPLGLIRFGDPYNKVTIDFQEALYDAIAQSSSRYFMGYYYGILFVDPSQPYELSQTVTITNTYTDKDGNTVNETETVNKPNPEYYYSTSLAEILKKLHLGTITHTQNSQTVEVGIINLSDDIISQAVINGFTNTEENYKVCVSKTQAFNQLIPNLSINFNNVYPFDPTSSDPKFGVQTFYVKLYSLDTTNWDVDDFITIEADASGKYEPPTSGSGS